MGGINHQELVVYYCYTQISFSFGLVFQHTVECFPFGSCRVMPSGGQEAVKICLPNPMGTTAGTLHKNWLLWRKKYINNFIVIRFCLLTRNGARAKQKRHHRHIRSYNVLHFVSAISTAWAYQLAALSLDPG